MSTEVPVPSWSRLILCCGCGRFLARGVKGVLDYLRSEIDQRS
jgi:hypothetical protein